MASTSIAKSAIDKLVAKGLGTFGGTSGWVLMAGSFAATPNTQIAVIDTPGEAPNPKWLVEYPQFQVLVRATPRAYEAAYQKAIDVRDALLGMPPEVINGDRWDGVTMMGNVSFLQYDDGDRPIFVGNYRVILEPAASALTNRQPL